MSDWSSDVCSSELLRAFDVGLHRLGVERRAVMEDDALAQVHGQRLAVVRPRPGGGELRDQLQLRRDVDQLVAQRGIDDAADEGARLTRIENLRLLLQSDPAGGGTRRRATPPP